MNDMEMALLLDRIDRLERQVERLEQQVIKHEHLGNAVIGARRSNPLTDVQTSRRDAR